MTFRIMGPGWHNGPIQRLSGSNHLGKLYRMQRETKLFAWFAITLGAAGSLMGLAALLGWPVQASGSSCKAICGLSLLFTEVLGDRAGMWVGGLLWLAVGLAFFGFGWRVRTERAA